MKLIIITLLVLLFSCESSTSEKITVELTPLQKEAVHFLKTSGFEMTDPIFEDNYLTIDDRVFDMDDIAIRIEKSKTSREKQYASEFQVDIQKVRDIKIFFSDEFPTKMIPTFKMAMREWSTITDSRLSMSIARNQAKADIIVVKIYNAYGKALFPTSDGAPGKIIWINPYLDKADWSTTMLHEIGHTIGLRHNFAPSETGVYSQIPGTPYNDRRSIMSYNKNKYLTYYDKLAISTLYPEFITR